MTIHEIWIDIVPVPRYVTSRQMIGYDMALNQEQQMFVDEVKSIADKLCKRVPANGIFLEAVAGSGKSTSIVNAVSAIKDKPLKILILAFNKAIANEMKTKVSGSSTLHIMTLNAKGHGHVMRYFKSIGIDSINMDPQRLDNIPEENYCMPFACKGRILFTNPYVVKGIARQLIAAGMAPFYAGMKDKFILETIMEDPPIMYESFRRFVSTNQQCRNLFYNESILKHFTGNDAIDHMFSIKYYDAVKKLMHEYCNIWSQSFRENGKMSFDDQLWIPSAVKNSKGYSIVFPEYDMIFVDESQDLSASNILYIKKMLKRTGVVIAVGDPKQTIYQFRGADNNAVSLMIKTFSLKHMHLSNTYRCCRAVTTYVSSMVKPNFRTFSTVEGSVIKLRNDAAHYPDWSKVNEKNSIVIAPAYRLLIPVALNLVASGRIFHSPELASLFSCKASLLAVDNMLKYEDAGRRADELTVGQASALLDVIKNDLGNQECPSFRAYGYANTAINILDPIMDTIIGFATTLPTKMDTPIITVLEMLERRMSCGKEYAYGAIRMSSIHKIKGKEYDTVYFFTGLSMDEPHKSFKSDLDMNLHYVGATRAERQLILYME